jgi:hypothetical protein
MQRRGKHISVYNNMRLYNEDPRQREMELMESLETAVEDDGEDIVCRIVVCEV